MHSVNTYPLPTSSKQMWAEIPVQQYSASFYLLSRYPEGRPIYAQKRLHTHLSSLHCTDDSSFALAMPPHQLLFASCRLVSLGHSFEALMQARAGREPATPESSLLSACFIGHLPNRQALHPLGSHMQSHKQIYM